MNLVRLLDNDHGNFMINDFTSRKPDEIKVYSVLFTVIVLVTIMAILVVEFSREAKNQLYTNEITKF